MKKFILKSILFIAIIFIIQLFIWSNFPHFTPIPYESILNYKKAKTDVIYFGDSTLHSVNKIDHDKTPLYGLVSEKLSPLSLGIIMHDSYQSEIELAYTKEMLKQKYFPKYIIVPINLRSFSPEWDLRPGFQFPDERVFLTYIHTPLEIFIPFFENFQVPEINSFDERIYHSAPVYNGDIFIGTAPQMEDTTHVPEYTDRLKQLMTYFYMNRIHNNHRKLKALVEIARLLKGTKTKVIFYITPIDIDTGNSLLGKDFEGRIAENSKLISKALMPYAHVINASNMLHTRDFSWKAEGWYANEHLLESGRKILSDKIAKDINILEK